MAVCFGLCSAFSLSLLFYLVHEAKEVLPTIPPSTSKGAFSDKCDYGWLEMPFSSSCYLIKEDLVTFNEAKNGCDDVNSQVVSVTSTEEQLFLQSTLRNLTKFQIFQK